MNFYQIADLVLSILSIIVNGASLVKASKDEQSNFVRCIKWLAGNGLVSSLKSLFIVFPAGISTAYNNGFFVYAYSYFFHTFTCILYTLFLFTILIMAFDRVVTGSKINVLKIHLILIAILIVTNIQRFFAVRPYCYVPEDYGAYTNEYDEFSSYTDFSHNGTVVEENEEECYAFDDHDTIISILNLVYVLVMHGISLIVLLVLFVKFLARGSNKEYGPLDGSSTNWEFKVFAIIGATTLLTYTVMLIKYLLLDVFYITIHYDSWIYPIAQVVSYSYVLTLTPYLIFGGR